MKYLPPYNQTAIIANIKNTTAITKIVLNIELTDSRIATTKTFKSLLWEINLRGLNTLSNLKILIEGIFIDYKDISNRELQTIQKSKIFQFSLKYDPLSKINPKEIIFKLISIVNI